MRDVELTEITSFVHFSDGEMPEKSLPQRHQSKNFGMGNDAQKGTLILFYTLTICPYNIILRYTHLDEPKVNPQWKITCFIITLGTDPSWRKEIWVSYLENDFCSAAHLLKPQTDQANRIFNLNKKTNKSLGILARAAGRLTSDLHHSLFSSNAASHLKLHPQLQQTTCGGSPIPSVPHSSSTPNFYTLTHDFISVPNSSRHPQGTHRQLQPGKPVDKLQNFTSLPFSPEPIPQSHPQICSRTSVASSPHSSGPNPKELRRSWCNALLSSLLRTSPVPSPLPHLHF